MRINRKDRIIYASRLLAFDERYLGDPVLCDFGDAQFGHKEYDLEVVPDLYRSPEMIIGIAWNEKIDIWCTGLVVRLIISTKIDTILAN